MTTKRFLILPAALAVAFSLYAAEETTPQFRGVVRRIDIAVKRVAPSVVREELVFQEGDELTAEKMDESRKNLHRLGLLKSLEMDAKWDQALNGYRVTVAADDGWFLLPMPMFGSRGGESFAALMLMERNYFRRAEGIMLFGSRSQGRDSAMASYSLPHLNILGGVFRSKVDEYQYADGGYNSKQFEDDLEREDPGDFGTYTNHYVKETSKEYFMLGGRASSWLRVSGGLAFSSVTYRDAEVSDPGDAGDMNAWVLSLDLGKEGRGDPATQGGFVGAFGRMFGLGMAGVKDSLSPLPKSETVRSLHLSLEKGETWLGSDAAYAKIMLTAGQATLFRDRSMLTLSLKDGWGDDLPPSQQWSTGQRGILTGVYAREYRGDSIAAASAVFTQPFFRNAIGTLNTEVFGDYAACRADGEQREKEGVGFNLVYRFWRVPLPFGGGATYSFDDRNWQISFAVGGMF